MFVTLYKCQLKSRLRIFTLDLKPWSKESTGKSREFSGSKGVGKDFLSRNQLCQLLRQRINKWDYMKLKSFCATEEMLCTLKRPPTE
jgi:hypothetical protein